MRRQLEAHEVVSHGELNHVNLHVRCVTVENDHVWLSIDLAVVDEPLVELAVNVEEHKPLHHVRVSKHVCGARHTLVVTSPVFLKTLPFEDISGGIASPVALIVATTATFSQLFDCLVPTTFWPRFAITRLDLNP